MTWELHRHDARHISQLLEPDSVDLIVTSPPYFALRSYRDECADCEGDGSGYRPVHSDAKVCSGCGETTNRKTCHNACGLPMKSLPKPPADEGACPSCNGTGRSHYDGQLGSEATPGEFIDNLIACTADWLKVLKPTGSLFVNLGDKYAGSGGGNQSGVLTHRNVALSQVHDNLAAFGAPRRYNQSSDGVKPKSRMALPWRYAIRCVDELGLILRADIIWSKPNGLPESVTDRVRISHEYIFHFTRQGRYFAAIDEVRVAHALKTLTHRGGGVSWGNDENPDNNWGDGKVREIDVRGKVPGSVWTIPSEPLTVPAELGVDHFAAYPSELVRRIVLGWTPTGWCTVCGEARAAVVEKDAVRRAERSQRSQTDAQAPAAQGRSGFTRDVTWMGENVATITGYRCACPNLDAPTTPAVVLDPFCGTGTTAAVAHHLGRHGIGTDLSSDYLKLAEWRCSSDQRLRDRVRDRSGIPNPKPPEIDGQLEMFGEGAA